MADEQKPRRWFPRLKRSLGFLLPDGWRGEVLDLSPTGLRIRSVAVLEVGASLDGKLVLPDGRTIALRAKVVWTSPTVRRGYVSSDIGIEIQEIPEEYLRVMSEFFAEGD